MNTPTKLNYDYVGIDPGATGALCHISKDNEIEFIDYKNGGMYAYATHIDNLDLNIVGLEKVSAMPGQGVKSMFSFGQRLGEIEGMLQTLAIGYILIRPMEWQKFCGIPAKSGKKGAYEALSKIYPHVSLLGPKGGIIDGRVDALGIAHYMRYKYEN